MAVYGHDLYLCNKHSNDPDLKSLVYERHVLGFPSYRQPMLHEGSEKCKRRKEVPPFECDADPDCHQRFDTERKCRRHEKRRHSNIQTNRRKLMELTTGLPSTLTLVLPNDVAIIRRYSETHWPPDLITSIPAANQYLLRIIARAFGQPRANLTVTTIQEANVPTRLCPYTSEHEVSGRQLALLAAGSVADDKMLAQSRSFTSQVEGILARERTDKALVFSVGLDGSTCSSDLFLTWVATQPACTLILHISKWDC